MRLAFKVLTVIGLTIALLMPLSMIRGTVRERQGYRDQAVETVARSSAGAQSLVGPVLFVPFEDRVTVMEPDDAVAAGDGGRPVGDDDEGPAFPSKRFQPFEDRLLHRFVQCAGCFVEDQHRRPLVDRSRDA